MQVGPLLQLLQQVVLLLLRLLPAVLQVIKCTVYACTSPQQLCVPDSVKHIASHYENRCLCVQACACHQFRLTVEEYLYMPTLAL